jgi:Fe-S cluster assembly iron-binding protein IscA
MKVTSAALEALSEVLSQTENPQAGIRIFAQDGCCGPGLQMAIAENILPNDKLISVDPVNFFVEEKAGEMLEGVTIDFGERGFRLDGLKRSGGCC